MNNIDNIWNQLKDKCFSEVRLMGSRSSILISKDKFKKFKDNFIYQGGVLKGTGMRTPQLLKHIHAKEYGDNVEVHIDYGNACRVRLFAIIHFFMDVIPYIVYCLYKYRKISFTPINLHKD